MNTEYTDEYRTVTFSHVQELIESAQGDEWSTAHNQLEVLYDDLNTMDPDDRELIGLDRECPTVEQGAYEAIGEYLAGAIV